ncbi:hypothetical protein AB1L30_21425 [Bremerella sp. JC817]|uniref:hypothetical protein n=1 Tax=Bremerella sp. JC817 TaxID=3231756 RepID=UPI0034587FD9
MNQEHDKAKYQPGEAPSSDQVASEDVIVSSDTQRDNRIPPGQSRTRKWPVLHASIVPEVTKETGRSACSGWSKKN